jgi:alkylhydroperoxidase family enzyme
VVWPDWSLCDDATLPRSLRELATRRSSPRVAAVESDVLAYAEAIVAAPAVPDDVFAPIRRRFSPAEVVELTMTITPYVGIAHFLGALSLEVEERIDIEDGLPDDSATTKEDA